VKDMSLRGGEEYWRMSKSIQIQKRIVYGRAITRAHTIIIGKRVRELETVNGHGA